MKSAQEVNCKILYCGPQKAGKKANLAKIYEQIPPAYRGPFIVTEGRETAILDLMPFELSGELGMKIRLRLCVVPWQPYYQTLRRQFFQNADGIVFVADSRSHRIDENLLVLKNLESDLRKDQIDIRRVPFVIQWNKRDCLVTASVEDLESKVNYLAAPSFEAVAVSGKGVIACLKKCIALAVARKKSEISASVSKGEEDLPDEPTPPRETADTSKKTRITERRICRMEKDFELTELFELSGIPKEVRSALRRSLSCVPRVVLESLAFEASLNGPRVRIVMGGEGAPVSRFEEKDSLVEWTLGQDLSGEAKDSAISDALAEILAMHVLPDYRELRKRAAVNENAYLKLELVKSLLTYRNYYKKYYARINRAFENGTFDHLVSWERTSELCLVALDLEASIFQSRNLRVSFFQVFHTVMEDKDPLLLILDYIHLLIKASLARKEIKNSDLAMHRAILAESVEHLKALSREDLEESGDRNRQGPSPEDELRKRLARIGEIRESVERDIFAIIEHIARFDVLDKLSLAGVRNYFKEFVLGEKFAQGEGERSPFLHFEDAGMRSLYQELIQSENRDDFYRRLHALLALVIGEEHAKSEVEELFCRYDLLDLEKWKEEKASLIKTTVSEILSDWMSPKFYEILERQLSGKPIGLADRIYIRKLRQGGKNADWIEEMFDLSFSEVDQSVRKIDGPGR